MARLILGLMLLATLVLAVSAVSRLASRAMPGPAPGPAGRKEDWMPQTLRLVAYGLLLALMIGVVTGWLGAA